MGALGIVKDSSPQLRLASYFQIKKGNRIPFIDERIQSILEGKSSLSVDIAPGPSIEEALARIEERKRRNSLPHQEALEKDMNIDLGWVQAHLGEEDALRLVEKDWLIIGQSLFFASQSPSYEEVKSAVSELVSKKQVSSAGE